VIKLKVIGMLVLFFFACITCLLEVQSFQRRLGLPYQLKLKHPPSHSAGPKQQLLHLHVDTGREIERPVPSLAYAVLWLGFTAYAFTVPIPETGSAEIIAKFLTTPDFSSGEFIPAHLNPIFFSIFNFLGVYPAIYAALLLPGGASQRLPPQPFVFSAFALGFFALGPYLCARKASTRAQARGMARGARVFESRAVGALLLAFASYALLVGGAGAVGDASAASEFARLVSSEKLVHVSTIDFIILTLAVSRQLTLTNLILHTHSLTHLLTHTLTHSLTYSLTHSLIHSSSLTHLVTHSANSFTHLLTHSSLKPSLT
jgi:hypothetical protein